jgi:hypothetical protein
MIMKLLFSCKFNPSLPLKDITSDCRPLDVNRSSMQLVRNGNSFGYTRAALKGDDITNRFLYRDCIQVVGWIFGHPFYFVKIFKSTIRHGWILHFRVNCLD